MPTTQIQPSRINRQQTLREMLNDPDTYATTLLVLFVDAYGTEGLEWAPETIKLQLAQDFGLALPTHALDRLMAAITIVTTNYFYKSLSRFIDLCNVLAGNDFAPGVVVPADSVECAWGITEAMIIDPPDEPEPFIDDIRYYIGAVLKNDGFVQPPDVLRIALDAADANKLNTDWADDPEMFAAAYQTQQGHTSEVEQMLRSRLGELFNQIKNMPLLNGDASQLIPKLGQAIRQAMSAAEQHEQL